MKALITGASSGIGREMAKYLDHLGYELIIVARSKEKLEQLASSLNKKPKIIVMDLMLESNIKSLYVLTKNENIDILINNAGFGTFGTFTETELTTELEMIDLNIKTVHMLTKMFLKDMKKKDKGYILNVASSAAFQPGPLMATYYSTKAYVLRLTEAIYYELKKENSKVHISCLCPGPVDTNFNQVAGVSFAVKPASAEEVSRYAIDQMLKNKMLIIPGFKMKCVKFFGRFLSDKKLMALAYRIQKKKQQPNKE
ncbi:MAG TPA: SDR family NAD(P)-dependent oxidoreductase [Candidatus Scybalousia intestinigallinarum]|nr:SDR family NAD(P)-dependent oxidoreductase [Candidatus Scybalousia intestinigallinarum]